MPTSASHSYGHLRSTNTWDGSQTMSAALLVNAGIQFPATQAASADANTLDDYEEGSWTPVLGGDGGTSGQTYVNQIGRYVKVGQMVTVYCEVDLSAKGIITGSVQIQGLPFATFNVTNGNLGGAVSFFGNFATNWIAMATYAQPNTSAAYLIGRQTAGATSAFMATADIANNTSVVIGLTYRANA